MKAIAQQDSALPADTPGLQWLVHGESESRFLVPWQGQSWSALSPAHWFTSGGSRGNTGGVRTGMLQPPSLLTSVSALPSRSISSLCGC